MLVFVVSNSGHGVFLTEDICKNSFVCEYSGELITAKEGYRREDLSGDASVYRFYFTFKKHDMWYVVFRILNCCQLLLS